MKREKKERKEIRSSEDEQCQNEAKPNKKRKKEMDMFNSSSEEINYPKKLKKQPAKNRVKKNSKK